MTIKGRLIINALASAVIVVAISLTSVMSMSFLKERLVHLTEKSTPLQIRTMELQQEMQGCVTALMKVNDASTITGYTSARAEAEKLLSNVKMARESLEKMGTLPSIAWTDIAGTAHEIFRASEERITSNSKAAEENTRVIQRMKESGKNLNDLDRALLNLQSTYSRNFASSIESTARSSARLDSIEGLRNLIRELQLLAVTVQNARKPSALLIARGKLKSLTGRIAANDHYKSDRSLAAVTKGFTDDLTEFIRIQSEALTLQSDASMNRAAESGKDIPYRLNDLFQTLDQETMLARDELNLANSRQGSIYSRSVTANAILRDNSRLVATGLQIAQETNSLITATSEKELENLLSGIHTLFISAKEISASIEKGLAGLNAADEIKTLRKAASSIEAVHSELHAADGIAEKLKRKLKAVQQADRATQKIQSLVDAQSEKGRMSISAARSEQENSIASVQSVAKRTLTRITVIGIAAIIIGMLAGLWIYRSVMSPLRLILDAVRSQQEHGREKAALAEAVSTGDLDIEVTVGKALKLDSSHLSNDEMGMVLQGVAGMSEAQVVLDRSFAAMTGSLRKSRDENRERERVQTGLAELNSFMRGDRSFEEMLDRSLSYLCSRIKAQVGVLYVSDEQTGRLEAAAAYAIGLADVRKKTFAPGEGIAGQAAKERTAIILDNVPDDYLPIRSALGESGPLHIAALPLVQGEQLAGLLEFGSFSSFARRDLDFLEQACRDLAVGIRINRSRSLVDRLLEETRVQAEELRLHQEQLQQTNEELEERARMLEQAAVSGKKRRS